MPLGALFKISTHYSQMLMEGKLIADKTLFLQFSKGRAARFLIFEQADFPQFLAQQILVAVAQ